MVSLKDYLQIHHLSKQYGKNTVLRDLSFSAEKGERIALVGPSGVGKTTLLRIITGLLSADSGKIMIEGKEISSVPVEKREIGMVFQNYLLFPFLSVQQNVEFGLKVKKLPDILRREKVARVLKLFQIDHLRHYMPHQLSSGQQQRTVFARAIVLQPQVLLLDEPFSNLDLHLRYESQKVLFCLHEEFHPTILMVSHNVDEVMLFAQKVGVLLRGEIIQYDTPRIVYEQPFSVEVARIFGNTNALPVHREKDAFRISRGGLIHAPEVLHRHGEGEKTILTCHPEHCKLHSRKLSGSNNSFPAVVSRKFYIGHRLRYQLSTDMGGWQVISSQNFSEGSRVYLQLPEKKLWSMRDESHPF